MTNEMELDDLDLEILDVVGDHSYWKAKIHEEMDTDAGLPVVARRVDALVQYGRLNHDEFWNTVDWYMDWNGEKAAGNYNPPRPNQALENRTPAEGVMNR